MSKQTETERVLIELQAIQVSKVFEALWRENKQLTLLAEAQRVNANFYRDLRKKLDKRLTGLLNENRELKRLNGLRDLEIGALIAERDELKRRVTNQSSTIHSLFFRKESDKIARYKRKARKLKQILEDTFEV